jgi:predicted Fe-Mo cluster-binding NifX family protein
MKMCIPATSADLDSTIDPRFGRCSYIVTVDPDTMEFGSMPNPNIGARGGAGIETARTVAKIGADVVITCELGPNAYEALKAAGIRTYMAPNGMSCRKAVENFKTEELDEFIVPLRGRGFRRW